MLIKKEFSFKTVINKSVFLAIVRHIDNEQSFKDFISETRKKYYDADHVVSAFKCGSLQRSSDDGEPSGTAGVPILNMLMKSELEEVAVLVVRYFGGVKLGASNLLRAYLNTATECVKQAPKVENILMYSYQLVLSYDKASKLEHALSQMAYEIRKDYDLNVTFSILSEKQINDEITNLCKGDWVSFKELDKTLVLKDII
ncbi:MAG: YigZ family protein [Erysipelotrichaceae bacterium]|nr:YigZ family protein [Erysipelotrichaceae bacterium]